jgi:hypothetical protein
MTDDIRTPAPRPGAAHPADHRHARGASTDPSDSTDPDVPSLSLDAIIETDPAPPDPAPHPASDVPDLPLTLGEASLFVDDPLPDWKADPVIAEFQEALLTLDLGDVTSGSPQADRAPGTTTRVPMPAEPELSRTPPQTPRDTTTAVRQATSQPAAAPPRSTAGAARPPATVPPATAPPPTTSPADAADEADRPLQDEWGVFDPAKCGFAALVARLNRLEREEDTGAPAPATRGKTTRR